MLKKIGAAAAGPAGWLPARCGALSRGLRPDTDGSPFVPAEGLCRWHSATCKGGVAATGVFI